MKLTLSFLTILSLLSQTILSQKVFDDQNELVIRQQKVKSITTWNHAITNGVVAPQGYKNAYNSYDEKSNLTEIINYKSTGNVFTMESYKYDSISQYQTGYVRYDGSQDKITMKKAFRYDNQGNRVREVGYDGASNYKNNFFYTNGKLSEIHYFMGELLYQKRVFDNKPGASVIKVLNDEDKFEFKMEQKYDAKGNLTEDIEYAPKKDDEIVKRFVYKYNAANKKIIEERYEFGKLSYRQHFTYNAKNQLIMVTEENIDGSKVEIEKYEYNAKGLLENEYFRKKNAKEFSIKTYKYNDKNICTEMECFYASYKYKVLFKYTYEFY